MRKLKGFANKRKRAIVIGGTIVGLTMIGVLGLKLLDYWYGRGFDLGQIATVELLRKVYNLDIPDEVLQDHARLCDKWSDLSAFFNEIEKI